LPRRCAPRNDSPGVFQQPARAICDEGLPRHCDREQSVAGSNPDFLPFFASAFLPSLRIEQFQRKHAHAKAGVKTGLTGKACEKKKMEAGCDCSPLEMGVNARELRVVLDPQQEILNIDGA